MHGHKCNTYDSACDTETYATADEYAGGYIMRDSCDSETNEKCCNCYELCVKMNYYFTMS